MKLIIDKDTIQEKAFFIRPEDENQPVMVIKVGDLLHNSTSLETANRWIPCTEKQPDENGQYLVTLKRQAPEELGGDCTKVALVRFIKGVWKCPIPMMADFDTDEIKYTVLAWQPISDVYREPEPEKQMLFGREM